MTRPWMGTLAVLIGLGASAPVRAALAEAPPPADVSAAIMLRSLAYERNLAGRAKGELVLAVVFEPGDADSVTERDEMVRAFGHVARHLQTVATQVRIVPVSRQGIEPLDVRLRANGAHVVYLCQGLSSQAVTSVLSVSRADSLITMTRHLALVELGVSLGVVREGSRPRLVVNLDATKAEGLDLRSDLLSLAKVIQRE